MKLLETQEQFESLWFGDPETTRPWIVYFTAAWCGPCQKLDLDALDVAAAQANIPFWKCEYTVNDYTAGYCNVRKFPTFVYFNPGKIRATHSSNVTSAVIDWIQSLSSI
jgi:hypothetical protein